VTAVIGLAWPRSHDARIDIQGFKVTTNTQIQSTARPNVIAAMSIAILDSRRERPGMALLPERRVVTSAFAQRRHTIRVDKCPLLQIANTGAATAYIRGRAVKVLGEGQKYPAMERVIDG
jgi:hypothetical protein